MRVFEYRLKPGEKEAKHTHPAGVVYALNNARMRTTTFPDGVTSVHDWHAGDVIWRDGITHSSENIGTTDYRAVSVEVKPCHRP